MSDKLLTGDDDRPGKAVCAIVLAAGESKRFGQSNKLFAEVDGVPILERVVAVLSSCGFGEIIMVTGADHEDTLSLLDGYGVRFVRNLNWADGMGSSLARGAAAVDESRFAGVSVCLGDLPALETGVVREIVRAFFDEAKSRIVVPVYQGSRGHPVIFPIRLISDLKGLSGDMGAKAVILKYGESVKEIAVKSEGVLKDVDTRKDLEGAG
jgi:molybdenum cofactor cytidylyltransferase